MSKDLQLKVNELSLENDNLKKQAEQNSEGVQNLLAQLDAHKQFINEILVGGINLRTNIILLQKQVQELSVKLQESNSKFLEVKTQLDNSLLQLNELQAGAQVAA